MADFSSGELDRMLAEARRTLESMRRSGAAGPSQNAEPVEGVGEAAEGRIRVTAVTGGRLKSVEINPRAMRLASQELGELLVIAVNAALDDLRAKAADPGAAEMVDVAALDRRVEEVQNQGLRQMELIRQAVSDTLGKLGDGR